MARQAYSWRQPPYPGDQSDSQWVEPCMIVLCQDGNTEEAIVPLLQTLYEPIGRKLIGAVFVHETMREGLIERVRDRMSVMHRQVKSHDFYAKALLRAECLGAELIAMMKPDDIGFKYSMVEGSPIVVCDFNQSYFSVNHPSTVVTLHTFRHTQELSELAVKEKLSFDSASIWCPKTATAYEMALILSVPVIYINCARVSLLPIAEKYKDQEAHSLLLGGYHYEVVIQKNRGKVIVFPASVQLLTKSQKLAKA